MKVKEYLVNRLVDVEAQLTSANRYKKMLEDEIEHFQDQLEAAHEFEKNVLLFAKTCLGIGKYTDGEHYISYGAGEKPYLWENKYPELYKFVKENLLWNLDDDGNLREELQPKEEDHEAMPF